MPSIASPGEPETRTPPEPAEKPKPKTGFFVEKINGPRTPEACAALDRFWSSFTKRIAERFEPLD